MYELENQVSSCLLPQSCIHDGDQMYKLMTVVNWSVDISRLSSCGSVMANGAFSFHLCPVTTVLCRHHRT